MAFSFNGIEGYSTRIGRVLGAINEVNNFRYGTTDDRVSVIISGYPFTDRIAIDDLISQRDQYRTTSQQWLQDLQNVAITTTIEQVNDEWPLTNPSLFNALTTLITNMEADGQAYSRPTTSATTTAALSNWGNAEFVTSLIDSEGLTLDMVIGETITSTVTAAAGSGATAFSEPLGIAGLPAVDGLSFLWPNGSGASTTIQISNGANASLVNNGGFDTWTATNVSPTSWEISTGTAGTTVVRSTDDYRGTYALEIAGNGSELTGVYQNITNNVLPNRVYCFGFWAKRDAGAAGGVLQVRLADSTGTTIQNDQSSNNLLSITVSSGLTTSYVFQHVFFQTPRVLPTETRLYINLSTAVTNGESIYIDLGSLVLATQIYPGGPFAAAFSGDTQSAQGDYYETVVTNSQSVGAFIPAMDRIFSLRTQGFRFPSTVGTPISSDALISPSS